MNTLALDKLVSLDVSTPIWDQVFTIAPLVIVGTQEGESFDLAPKHMAFPMGFDNYFGFVCTPAHQTYHNAKKFKAFSVSFPTPEQIISTSLSASRRLEGLSKSDSILNALGVASAIQIEAPVIRDAYLYLECSLHKIIDGFGTNSLITGIIEAAYVDKNYHRASEVDEGQRIHDHPLLAYVANGRFAEVSETYNFPYPKDFSR
ncbi:MAG: flavin reductase [Bacteroidia bacterium]|nr:flavin reductase [Bacteroidia bacterium]